MDIEYGYVVGKKEDLEELYPTLNSEDIVPFNSDDMMCKIEISKVVSDPRVRCLTHAEIIKATTVVDGDLDE